MRNSTSWQALMYQAEVIEDPLLCPCCHQDMIINDTEEFNIALCYNDRCPFAYSRAYDTLQELKEAIWAYE